MRRVLYWKRLLIVVVAALLLAGGVFAIHHFQANSQSAVIKGRAEQLAAAAETEPSQRPEAIKLYGRYLKFKPTDEAAFQKYASLLFEEAKADPKPATVEQAANGVEAFLRAFPNHPEERQKLVDLYLKTAQFGKLSIAKQHLEMLLNSPTGDYRNNIDVREMAAACDQGLGNLPGAIAHLEAAIGTGKAPVRVYGLAMQLHAANKDDAQRNLPIDDHLRTLRSGRFELNLEARVAAARFEITRASAPGALRNFSAARQDLDKAFGREPGFPNLGGDNNADALLAQAELELAVIDSPEQIAPQRTKAEGYLRRAFALDKKNVAIGMLLAEVATLLGKMDEGVQVLKQTAEALGDIDDRYYPVIDRMIDLGEKEFSESLVKGKLEPDESKKVIVTYFKGRLAVLKSDWLTAQQLLEEAAPPLARLPDYHKRAMLGLAACYAAMQNPDRQLECAQAALRDDNSYVLAQIYEAEALVKMGRNEDALKRYRLLVGTHQLVAYRPELVRLELLEAVARPGETETRSWARFEESLGQPPAARAAEIHIYNAESLIARNRAAEAVQLLEDWLAKHPKDPKAPGVWVALARIKDIGKQEGAASVLDRAEKAVGDTVEFRLARAAMLSVGAKPVAPADLDPLGAGTEKFAKADQFRLLFGLGQVAARVADRGPEGDAANALRAAALRFLRAAADLSPKNLTCRALLLDQGLAAGRRDVVEQAIKEMASVEGESGPVATLGRIAIRLPEVKKIADTAARAAGVKELRELAARVRDLRPGWSRVYVALAQLDELEGLNDAALVNYRQAIDKGDRQEFVIRRAVDLYRTKQQDDQALGLLNKLSTEMRLPDDLERYRAIRYLFHTAELPKDARPTIDRNAPANSTDYRMLLLRGALLAAIHHDDDALAAFSRAVELADKVPDTWLALVGQLVRHGKVEEAKRAVAEAEKKLTAAPAATPAAEAERRVALGGLHEMIGDLKTALTHFSAARAAAPLELSPTRQLVLFLQHTGQMDSSYQLLQDATQSGAKDVARWARRHLALTMMTRPDAYSLRGEALALIQRNLDAAPDDPEDLKARAYVQIVDPATREEGIRTLREFEKKADLTPDEYFLLGRLAYDQAKFAEAEDYFRKGARQRPGVTAEHLAAVVRVYLALATPGDAEAALERLKAAHPRSWEAVREEARVLAYKIKVRSAQGGPEDVKKEEIQKLREQARAAIMKYPGWDAVANLASKSGPLFEELRLYADAENAYTKFLAQSNSPSAHGPLAVFYIHRKQTDRAIRLAREHEKKAPVLLTAQLLTGAIRVRRADPATEADIAKWLDDSLRAAAGKRDLEAGLIGARAELLDAQGNYDEAIKEYERAIAKSKTDALVNNLCMLMVLKNPARAEEAVKMMSDLIAIRGPVPTFLDTRAMAYLLSARPELAVKDLQMALVQYERAVYRFHLAWAMDLDTAEGKRILAVNELEQAKRLGLTASDLHPIEHKRYRELFAKYAIPPEDK